MTSDTKKLRALAEAATPGPWTTERNFGIPSTRLVDTGVCQGEEDDEDSAFPRGPATKRAAGEAWNGNWRQQAQHDAAFIAAANPQAVIALLDEIERLRANRDHSCACSANDGSAPLVKHDKGCPIRVNARRRIAPEVAMDRIAAALHSGAENDDLRAQIAAATAARDEACDIAARVIADVQVLPSADSCRIAELRKVGAK